MVELFICYSPSELCFQQPFSKTVTLYIAMFTENIRDSLGDVVIRCWRQLVHLYHRMNFRLLLWNMSLIQIKFM